MNQSESINELAGALAKAQGEFTPAIKDAANPYYKSKYANLCSVNKACQQPLSKNGLSISQSTIRDAQGNWILITKLLHQSGQWMSSETPIITAKSDIQSFGSAITYSRRYGLSAIVGVVTDEDDDGNTNVEDPRVKKPKIEVEKQLDSITKEQEVLLRELLSKCSSEFQESVWKFLTDTAKINSYSELTPRLFETIKKRIMNELEVKSETN